MKAALINAKDALQLEELL